MNARKCVHAQKPYPSQAFVHESSKVGGRETGKTEARRVIERKAAQKKKKKKNIGGTKTIKAYLGTAKVNKVGGGTPNFP